MGEPRKSRRILLSRSRAIVRDILHYSERIPLCAHERRIELASIDDLRKQCDTRISWPVVFLKAYGVIAQRNAALRSWYVDWPLPHVFQHDENDAKLVMKREYQGDDWLFWARFRQPERSSLAELQQQLNEYQSAPVEETFRQQIRLAALPTLVRRMLWWCTRNLAGRKRAKRMGTFSLTTVAGQGTMIPQPPSMLTSTISYGPIDEHGCATVSLTYDHRLMDGHHVADFLEQLDVQLHAAIASELAELAAGTPGEVIEMAAESPNDSQGSSARRAAAASKHIA